MSSSSHKKKLLRNFVAVNIGCNCGRPKISDILHPIPKNKLSATSTNPDRNRSSPSSWEKTDGGDSTTAFSLITDTSSPYSFGEINCRDSTKKVTGITESPEYPYPRRETPDTYQRFGKIGESVAVVKDSDDPFLDFRQSMFQMIVEKEIYSREDLTELLDCFLSLNSPYHHVIILRAFTEICDSVFSTKSSLKSKLRYRLKTSREF